MSYKTPRRLLMAVANFLFSFISLQTIQAQRTHVQILDSQTQLPVQFLSITIEDPLKIKKPFIISIDSGQWSPNYKNTIIAEVHCLGYGPQKDTIKVNQSKTIFLKSDPLFVNEVVITGQYNAVSADKSIYSIKVINHQQIKDNAANTLSNLLSGETNYRITQDASLGANITLQGISGENVKVLIDGVPISGRQNGFVDLNQILLSNVDHVEIIEGPLSVIYGSNALAGAINIITKDNNPLSKKRWMGQINSYMESVGIYNFDGNITYKAHHSSFSINSGRYFFGGYRSVDTTRSQPWKPKQQYFANADYKYSNAKNLFRLSTGIFKEELRNRGDTFNYVYAFDEFYYTTRLNIHSDYTYKTSAKSNLQFTSAYSYYSKDKVTKQIDFTDLSSVVIKDSTKQDTTVFNDWLGRLTYTSTNYKSLHFQTGIDYNNEAVNGHRTTGKKSIYEDALFLTFTFHPESKLSFQGGFRLISNARYSAPIVYSSHLKYSPSPFLNFRVSYGTGFRSPSLKELYLNFVDINHDVHGNDSLKAESSKNLNFSTSYIFKNERLKASINFAAFYNKFHDKIDFLYDFYSPGRAVYYNIPEENFITRGLEFNGGLVLKSGLSFNGGYYFLQRSQIPESTKFYHGNDFTFSVKYPIPVVNIRLSSIYKYTDAWFENSIKRDNINNVVQTFPMKMNGYSTMNIVLQKSFFKEHLEVSAGVKNIFNVKSVFSSGSSSNPHNGGTNTESLVGWGRSMFVGLKYNIL